MTIDPAVLNLLSDTVLYDEARQFLRDHPEAAENRQLMGLLSFSHNWRDLTDHITHQAERDWVNKEHYRTFYRALDAYLKAPHKGLRPRVKSEFNLVPDDLPRKAERELLDVWAQALAHEFLQHLVAEAHYQKITTEETS